MNNLNPEEKWNQWFAGLTDGDGCFVISQKEKTISFEITAHVSDARLLYNIKNKLKAGTVKLRSGSNSVRYRIKQKAIIFDIVRKLNGKLYHPERINQLKNVCAMFNLTYIQAPILILQPNGYLAGLMDSDGSFAISVTNSSKKDSQISGVPGRITRLANAKGFSQISAKVTSSQEDFLKAVQQSYNLGTIYVEQANPKKKSPNPKYHLTIKSENEFIVLYEYLKKYPLKSVKMHRMRLALLYFKYKKLRYHLAPSETIQNRIWEKFSSSWYKYSY
jgi:hypothetical protein